LVKRNNGMMINFRIIGDDEYPVPRYKRPAGRDSIDW
jgi:hypothetical protein